MKYIKELCIGAIMIALSVLLFQLFKNQKELQQALSTYGVMIKHTAGEGPAAAPMVLMPVQPWAVVQEKARNTVVQVIAQTAEINILQPYKTPKQNMGSGTAFFITEAGELITNYHVIAEAQAIWIKIPSLGKIIIDAEVVGKSPERDLALLRVSQEGLAIIKDKLGTIPFLPLGNSDIVKRVDEVLTIGYPLGQTSLKSNTGVVSGREHIAGRLFIQIDSPINPGNSGGPALNMAGEVIGITSCGIPGAQNVGYIIPSNELKMVLPDLRKVSLLRRPFLGFFLNSGSEELAKHLGNPVPSGCYIVDVYSTSPLSKAGVKAGDMIYEINGIGVDEYGDLCVSWSEDKLSLMDYISMLEIGQTVHIVVYRNGVRKEVSLLFDRTELAPVRQIFLDDDRIDYEIFGGMLIQPLALNHVPALVGNAPILTRYGVPKNQMEPALIVTHIVPNSQIQRLNLLGEGALLSEVNGKKVKTMDDLRHAIGQGIDKERITFKTEDGVFFVLNVKKVLEDEAKLSQTYQYPLSPFIKQLLNKVLVTEKKVVAASMSSKNLPVAPATV